MLLSSAAFYTSPRPVVYSDSLPLSTFLAEAAERWPTRPFMVADVQLTYEKAWYKTLQIATWLQRNGVSRGDRVLAVLHDSADLRLITLAIMHVGAVISVLSPQVRAESFGKIVEECQPMCVFLEKTSRHLKPALEDILTVWMDFSLNKGRWEEADFSEVMATAPAWGMPFPGHTDDPAVLVYPAAAARDTHGVVLSHSSLCGPAGKEDNGGQLIGSALSITLPEDERQVAVAA